MTEDVYNKYAFSFNDRISKYDKLIIWNNSGVEWII